MTEAFEKEGETRADISRRSRLSLRGTLCCLRLCREGRHQTQALDLGPEP